MSDELMYALLTPVHDQWRTSVMSLAGDLMCGALPDCDTATASTEQAQEIFSELLHSAYGLDEPVRAGRQQSTKTVGARRSTAPDYNPSTLNS